MEIGIKIAITAIVLALIYGQLFFLRGVWRSHIDPKETASKLIKSLILESNVIATRQVDKIYQNGQVVGTVAGNVGKTDDGVTFQHLCETAHLDREHPIEYGRRTLRITGFKGFSMQRLVINQDGSSAIRSDTLDEVVCVEQRSNIAPQAPGSEDLKGAIQK